ncbi:hypothetical protein ACLOJK_001718 [Asimina triloba]
MHDIVAELFEEMKSKGVPPDESTYDVLIENLCLRGRIGQSLGLLKEMESSGCTRSILQYNTLIVGLCKNKRVKKAEEIFDEIELQGISRDLETYSSLIDGLCRCNQVNEAAELLGKMIIEGLNLTRIGRVDIALRLQRSLQSEGMVPTPQAYSPLLVALFKLQMTEEAMTLFREMIKEGSPPNATTYGMVFCGLCRAGGPIGEVADFVVEMTDKGVLPM